MSRRERNVPTVRERREERVRAAILKKKKEFQFEICNIFV